MGKEKSSIDVMTERKIKLYIEDIKIILTGQHQCQSTCGGIYGHATIQ